jgi:hypothetical protein
MSETPDLPQPDPALRRLDRLVGRWSMEGNLVGAGEKNIRGDSPRSLRARSCITYWGPRARSSRSLAVGAARLTRRD